MCNVCVRQRKDANHPFSICPILWAQEEAQARLAIAKSCGSCYHCGEGGHIARNCPHKDHNHDCPNENGNHFLVFCPNSPKNLHNSNLDAKAQPFEPSPTDGAELQGAVGGADPDADQTALKTKVTKDIKDMPPQETGESPLVDHGKRFSM